jgi:hypothetical protein
MRSRNAGYESNVGDTRMRLIDFIAGIGMAVLVGGSAPADAAQRNAFQASFSPVYKGFNYVSYYNGGYENADSLPALVGTGANSAALTLDYCIDVRNSAVDADATYTDSLTALAATVTEAKGRSLIDMVRPLIDFLDPSKIGANHVGDWRSFYNPTNAAAFFASYKTMIVGVAQVAQANGAELLCIGAELDQLTGPAYLSYWTDIIASVRAAFTGRLTYSADWDCRFPRPGRSARCRPIGASSERPISTATASATFCGATATSARWRSG